MSAVVMTLDAVAGKLNCKTGPDLIVATAAFLTLGPTKMARFTRADIGREMRKSSYYKISYSSNLMTCLKTLSRQQKFHIIGRDLYQLAPALRRKLENVLLDDQSTDIVDKLRQNLRFIRSDSTDLIEEAIGCIKHNFHRGAVVLSWAGAISVLQNHVVEEHLATFNREAAKRIHKWQTAATADDLSAMKESIFLDILVAISVIGHDVKKELKNCLTLRNSCSHPNALKIGQARVAAHVEILLLNVFEKYLVIDN